MIPGETQPDVESLAAIPTDQEFEIVRVLLHDGGRADPSHHLRPGRYWRCRYNGSAIMLLVNRTGQTISIARDEARFIMVKRTAALR